MDIFFFTVCQTIDILLLNILLYLLYFIDNIYLFIYEW